MIYKSTYIYVLFTLSMGFEIGSHEEISLPVAIRTHILSIALLCSYQSTKRRRIRTYACDDIFTYVRYVIMGVSIGLFYNNFIRIKNPFSSVIYTIHLIRFYVLYSDAYCFPIVQRYREDSTTYSYCSRFILVLRRIFFTNV